MDGPLPLPIPEPGELARHVDFVRRLARGLVRDSATSEDLAQDAWVAALERREPLAGSWRAWIARVLRNRAALAHRGQERRARREARHALEEPCVPTAELVERMELHGRVVAAVLDLPEPYRDVVLRRYFQDERPHEIALRLGVPEATVRTRLARAQERLRHRLQAEFGGERVPALLALARLAGEAPPSNLAPLATSTLVLAMKKSLVALTVALLALIAVWSTARGRARAHHPEELAARDAVAAPAVVSAPEPVPEVAELPGVARVPAEVPDPVGTRPAEAEPEVPIAEAVEEETAWLEFHVRDPQGLPISEAKVSVICYRTRKDPGSSHSLSEMMPVGVTDADGVARLEYPRRLDAWNGPENPEIGSVCYTVTHPDFVAVTEQRLDVDQVPVRVVLRHGALLIVAGFIGERARLLADVEPHLTDEVRVEAADWVPVRDGRPSCNRLPPGRHALYLTREGEGGTWASEVAQFELAEEEVKELTLELHPPRTLTGHLDPLVPRPVQNGEVLLNLYIGPPEDRTAPRSTRLFRASVAADGSFEIDGLPPGAGEMIGMCDGWVSKGASDDRGSAEEGAFVFELQQVDPRREEPFVLAMEPTARLEIVALGPDDEPVEGALVHLWPNVHWSIGYSQIFLDREWRAVTDANGRAEIVNLPADEEELSLVHGSLCLPVVLTTWGAERRWAKAALEPGATTTLELRLEPCKEEAR